MPCELFAAEPASGALYFYLVCRVVLPVPTSAHAHGQPRWS